MVDYDARYSRSAYAYGTQASAIVADAARHLSPNSRVVLLGEGEGRNACALAALGHWCVAVDTSRVGLAKCAKLAKRHGVGVDCVLADARHFRARADAVALARGVEENVPCDSLLRNLARR